MHPIVAHFMGHAERLADCAALETVNQGGSEGSGWGNLCLRPTRPDAVGVIFNITCYGDTSYMGAVALHDQAGVPWELGEDLEDDKESIDQVLRIAVEGRATAFHRGRNGGCIEERWGDKVHRSWMNAVPTPLWRKRWKRIDYSPYR